MDAFLSRETQMEQQYRLCQKRNGKYFLQVRVTHTFIDYNNNKVKKREAWETLPTMIEGEQNETHTKSI